MRPLRGLVFSVMASSAFYPIIIKTFQVGWSRANAEYGASLYALTILIYLCSVTIYAVSVSLPLFWARYSPTHTLCFADMFYFEIVEGNRVMETWILRYLGPFSPDIPRGHGDWANSSLFGVRQSFESILYCEARPMPGLNRL